MTEFYQPSSGIVYTEENLRAKTGYSPDSDPEYLAANGIYIINSTPDPYDPGLYDSAAVYTLVGNYADQGWTATDKPLLEAKENGSSELKEVAAAQVETINLDYGLNAFSFAGIASQVSPPTRYQDVLDAVTAVTDGLDVNLTAVEAATTVDEINNIVNKPTGLLFTGRGSGLGPEDLNVSYYNEFNSVSMTEAETELYVPSTATVIPYGSGGPGQFDSMGNAFNAGGPYVMQIRETATSMVIAEIEVPLNAAGEDVAF